jgi:HYR domain
VSRLFGGARLRSRTLKTIVVLGAVVALASIMVGSASADVESSLISPDEASYNGTPPDGHASPQSPIESEGWYVNRTVAGTLSLPLPDPDHQGVKNITCKQSTNNAIVGSFSGEDLDGHPNVSIALTGENPDFGEGIVVNCTGTLLQQRQICFPFIGCEYVSNLGYEEVGAIVWHVGPWMIDHSPPIDVALTPKTSPNANGWYNTPAFVQITASDFQSGIHHCAINSTTLSLGPLPDSFPSFGFGAPIFSPEVQATPEGVQAIRPPDGTSKAIAGSCVNAAGSTSFTESHYNYDATAPTITVPATQTVNATSPAGATVNYSAPISDALSGIASSGCSPASGSVFPIGQTTVTCNATDKAGNSAASQSFTVQVNGAAAQLSALLAAVTNVAPGSSMADKLKQIQGYIAINDKASACSGLTNFISLVKAQSGKKLTAAQATSFIAQANNIRATLGC